MSMTHVLVLITVFTSASGVHSQTAFKEFADREACEQAAAAIRQGVVGVSGTLGREVIAQCHPLGSTQR